MNSPRSPRSIRSFLLAAALVMGGASVLAQAPPNDNLANATMLTGTNATATSATVGATAELNEPAHAGVAANHSIWYLWTASDDGLVLIDLSGSVTNTVVAVYVGKYMDQLTPVASNAGGNPDGTGRCFFPVTAGGLYDIAVDVSAAPGPVDLKLQFARSYVPPQITQQPSDETVLQGDAATFSVAASSDAPLSYQWFDNHGNAISSGTNSLLLLTNVSPGQSGNYWVVVSNAGGSTTSGIAVLTVTPRPVNDDFANRIPLSGSAVTTTGSNVFATTEAGEPNPRGWASPQSVWWSWSAPTNGLAFVDVTNYAGSQVLAIYTGDTLAQLTAVASASCYTTPLAVEFEVAGGTSYQIAVAGVGGSSGTFQLDLSFVATNIPPAISQSPANQTVALGGTASFQVAAISGLPISYQWEFNGSPLASATRSALVLTNVSVSQAGPYQVIVSGAGGSATSATAYLTVNVPPSNDNFTNALPLSGMDISITGDNQFATSEPGEPFHGGFPPGASVWWGWTTRAVGDALVSVTGFSGVETLGVYTGDAVSNLTLVVSNASSAGALSVHFAATNPSSIYWIAAADPSGIGGAFQLRATLARSNFPPTVVQQPPPVTTVTLSASNSLRWVLESDFPVTGQWLLNGAPYGGGGGGVTFSGGDAGGGGGYWTGTLVLGGLSGADVGSNLLTSIWTCFGGSVTTTNSVVVVLPASNDNFTNAIPLGAQNLPTSGSTLYATLEPGEPTYAGLTSGGSVWWNWTAPVDGTASFSVTGTNASAQILQIFTGNALTNLVTVARSSPGQTSPTASFVATAGSTYQVAVVGGDATFQLGLQFLPASAPPTITSQPVGVTASLGGNAAFQVGASGGGGLTYQWQFNGTNLAGANKSTLALSSVQASQGGPYDVIVSNPGGSVTSIIAALTITLAPPNDNFTNRIVLTGTNVTTTGWNTNATSETGEPSHATWGSGKSVWYSWTAPTNGVASVAVTNFTGNQVLVIYTGLSLTGLSAVTNRDWLHRPMVVQFKVTSGTAYQIVVAGESGVGGLFELDAAFTPVVFPPQITQFTQQPTNGIVTEGDGASFQVAATGVGPLSYQWQFYAGDLPGATDAMLTLNGVTPVQAGPYQVLVTNPGGSVTSRIASLRVNPRPVNDNFANRIFLTGEQVSTNGSNQFGSSEPNEPAHGGYGPFETVWWSYTPPLRGIITASLANSFSNAVMAVYTGSNLSQLTLVASNAFGTFDSGATFLGEAGVAYQIAVQGSSSNAFGAISLAITGDFPPTIDSQPTNQAIAPGEEATFSVTANSQSSMSYQWFFGDAQIAGATNQILVLTNVSANELGNYSVQVGNDVGSATSAMASLTFTTMLAGQITDATTGDPLPGVLVWAGSVTNVSDINGNYRLLGVQAAPLETDFDASPRSGTWPLSVQFSDQSSLNAVVLQAVTNGYYAYSNNDVVISPGQGVTNSFSLSPILPDGAMRLVLNWGAQPRDLDANLLTPSLEGQVYQVYYQTGNRGSLTNLPFAALDHDSTNGFGPESITIAQFFAGTYTYFVHKYAGIGSLAGSGATVKIYTAAGLAQTLVAPATGDGDFWTVCAIDGATREITLVNQIQSVKPAERARVLAGSPKPRGTGTSGGIRPLDLAPGTANFLWDFGDGGASTLEDPLHVYTRAGLYSVTLTVTTTNNVAQSVTKANFIEVLGPVAQPPSISSQPTNEVVIAGGTAGFQATVSGSDPLSYQWFFNQTNALAGATNALLLLTNAQPSDEGAYSVVVTNVAGAVASSNAWLTVLSPPTITGQPTNLTVVAGAVASFQVMANGSGPLSYQWFFNQTNALSGATNTMLVVTNAQPANVGTYSVLVTNVAGAVTSSNAWLTVLVPPTITGQPTNLTVVAGGMASYQVIANGSGPLSYQWLFNQTNALAGATNATLALTNAQQANAGAYSVVVTNVAGVVASSNAWLTVLAPPTITGQPTNLTVVAGGTASFQVIANGSGSLSYQWLFNQTNVLMGATNAALTFSGVQTAIMGGYSVVVTNAAGAVTSAVAALTVLGQPSIVMQPTNLTVIAGAPVSFQVTANGSGLLSYQWFFNQTNALAGATNTILVVTNAQPANVGTYSVWVTNVAGAVTSSNAWLTVLVPPTITSQPTNLTVVAGATASFQVAAIGSGPLSYQWLFDQTNAITGATNATLTLAGVQAAIMGGYSVVVTNAAGAVTSVVAALTVLGPPSIVMQPTNLTVVVGGTASFQVIANGSGPLSYQWFFNQTNALAGATNTILVVTNAQPANVGTYSVLVTNVAGAVASSNAWLTVLMPPTITGQPTNLTIIAGATAGFQVIANGSSPLSYQWFFNQTDALPGATNATLKLAGVQTAVAGGYSVVVTNTAGAVTSVVAALTVLGPPSLVMQPTNLTVVVGATASFQVAANGSEPLSYQWFFNQTNALAGATNTILVVTNAQPANVGTYSVWVTNVAGAVVSSNAWLTVLMPPTITGQPTNLTVVAGATASFQVIANGSGLLSYQWLFNQTSVLMGATNASLTLAGAQTAAAGGYSVVVTNSAGAVTSVVAALTVFGPPSIVMQPTNLTVVAGATAGFQVTANGSGPLSYQWFFNQTNALAGATNTMLVVSNAQPANGGAYSVVVTNVAGSVPSSAATLTIISPPSIAQQPVSITTNQGAQVVFSIAATGSLPLTYQWWFNGATALPSATSATLVLPSVQMSQAGSYSATVMNAAGTVKSEAANLVVVGGALAVALTAPAAYSNYCAGSDVQLTALVTTNQYSIASVDFYAGGTHLGASLSAPYRFDWASPQDGSYTLSARVTDVLGNTAVSPPVGITVTPQCQPVAIVRAAADPEIDAMRDYLLEMGFGSQVFDQAGLTAGQLQSFKLVIWDDVGAPANTLSANTVDALAQLYANGMPLYLIGDHLVSADLRLPQPQQTEWAGLTHLSGPGDLTGNNTIFIVNNEGSSNPVLWGEFFTVTNFAYPLPVEMAVNDSASEMYAESAGACVLAGYPSMSSGAFQTPILTQNLRVLPLDAGASTNDLRGLFQNAVCWLTGCRCQDADLGLDVGPVTNVVVVGQLLSYGLIASSGLVGSSECAPLGVTVTNPLPSGFEFIGASAEQGSWAYDPLQRQVVFYIGLMPKVGTVDLAVTVMPTQFGTFTNQPVIRLSQGGTAGEKLSWLDPPMVITVIAGTNSAPARLRARLLAPSALQLSLSGRSGVLYNVQSSPDLSHWAGFTNVLGPVWTQEIPLSPGTNSSRRFYRAVDP